MSLSFACVCSLCLLCFALLLWFCLLWFALLWFACNNMELSWAVLSRFRGCPSRSFVLKGETQRKPTGNATVPPSWARFFGPLDPTHTAEAPPSCRGPPGWWTPTGRRPPGSACPGPWRSTPPWPACLERVRKATRRVGSRQATGGSPGWLSSWLG